MYEPARIQPPRNLLTYRERDKPDVVVDGKTTFISSVSIALIVSKLRRASLRGVASISQPWQPPGDARDGLP